jgi:hypothetical protein
MRAGRRSDGRRGAASGRVLVAVLVSALVLAAARPVGAAESSSGSPFRLSGYLKSFSIGYSLAQPEDTPDALALPLLGQSFFDFRLDLHYSPADQVSVLVAYDLSPRIQDPFFFKASPFAVSIVEGRYRAADFRDPIVPGPDDTPGSFGLYHNLDRLNVTIRFKFADLIVGRQPVAWGDGKVVSPTDIIAPFSFYDLDKEERFGVDAVRMRIPLSELSELDFGYVAGKDFRFDRSAFFLKGRVHVLKTDVSLIGIGFQDDFLAGLDLARSIGGSGVWLEAARVWPDALSDVQPKPPAYTRLTAGIDRSLTSKLYAFLEYHFNSPGSSRPADYVALFSTPAYTRGTDYLLGKHYLNLGLTYQAGALIPVTGLVIWNLSDGSFALAPQADYNIAENIYLGGGLYLGLGRRPLTPLFGASGVAPALRSEFGSYPDFGYVSFRVYF